MKKTKPQSRIPISEQVAKLRKKGLPSFERPQKSVAFCAEFHKGGTRPLIVQIEEGDIVIAPWFNKKYERQVVNMIMEYDEVDAISIMRSKGKASVCAFKKEIR